MVTILHLKLGDGNGAVRYYNIRTKRGLSSSGVFFSTCYITLFSEELFYDVDAHRGTMLRTSSDARAEVYVTFDTVLIKHISIVTIILYVTRCIFLRPVRFHARDDT